MESYDWSLESIYLLYSAMGVVYILGYGIVHIFGTYFSPRAFLNLSILLSALGYLFLCSIHISEYSVMLTLIGYFLITVSFPLMKQYILILYSYIDDNLYSVRSI